MSIDGPNHKFTFSDCSYLAYTHHRVNNAGAKPLADSELTFGRLGMRNIGIRPRWVGSVSFSYHFNRLVSLRAILSRMPRNKVVVLQYPEQWLVRHLFRRAKALGNKVVLLVHDINPLRGGELDHEEVIDGADVVVAHTARMRQWLEARRPGRPVVELGPFDYLISGPQGKHVDGGPVRIVFAGNLTKADFLGKLSLNEGIELCVFGNRVEGISKWHPSVRYMGSLPSAELHNILPGFDFGLVWDGDSLDGCTGPTGEYLRYNSPFKLSSYLAAGLPVIYWNEMSVGEAVGSAGIGIDSLSGLSAAIESHKADIPSIRSASERLGRSIRRGENLERAISRALDILNDRKSTTSSK